MEGSQQEPALPLPFHGCFIFEKIPQFIPLLNRLNSSHLFIMRIENMFIKAMRIYAHMDIYIYLYVYMYIDENI